MFATTTEKAEALLRALGRTSQGVARHVGGIALLFGGIVGALLRGRVSLRAVIAQAYSMGVQSMPLVCVTGMLSGLVTSQQGGYQFTGSVPLYVVAASSPRALSSNWGRS